MIQAAPAALECETVVLCQHCGHLADLWIVGSRFIFLSYLCCHICLTFFSLPSSWDTICGERLTFSHFPKMSPFRNLILTELLWFPCDNVNMYHHHRNEEAHIGVREVSKKRRAQLHNLMRLPPVCPWHRNWLEIGRLFGQLIAAPSHARGQKCHWQRLAGPPIPLVS